MKNESNSLSENRTPVAWTPRAGIVLTHHASTRLRQYGLPQLDLLRAIGPSSVADGRLTCAFANEATGVVARAGSPLVIGRQFPPGRPVRYVLLTSTQRGERLHVVVSPRTHSLIVLTVWRPGDPDNRTFWDPDSCAPTRSGERAMPPTDWVTRRSPRPLSTIGAAA